MDIDDLCRMPQRKRCHKVLLHPFLCNVESKGGFFARWLNRNVSFFVDAFHVGKHTEPCCMPPDNPACRYHPLLPRLSEVHGVNTECAEQAFRWLNKLKLSLKQMHEHRFNFFLQTIIHNHNMYIVYFCIFFSKFFNM